MVWDVAAAGLKLLILFFCANFDWWELLLFSSTSPYSPSTSRIERHCRCHIVSRRLCIVLFFSYCLNQKERGERKKKSQTMLSEQNPALSFQRLMTEAVCVWEPTEESGWKNVNIAVTNSTDRQGWLLMSRSYLAGNLERGQHLCVLACGDASKLAVGMQIKQHRRCLARPHTN